MGHPETVAAMVVLAILIAILYPVSRGAQPAATRTYCLSNVKQLGTATMIYWSDQESMR